MLSGHAQIASNDIAPAPANSAAYAASCTCSAAGRAQHQELASHVVPSTCSKRCCVQRYPLHHEQHAWTDAARDSNVPARLRFVKPKS